MYITQNTEIIANNYTEIIFTLFMRINLPLAFKYFNFIIPVLVVVYVKEKSVSTFPGLFAKPVSVRTFSFKCFSYSRGCMWP
jgi:hypothetical protein